MSDQESSVARKRAARVLVALFAVGAPFAGAGVVIYATVPNVPSMLAPCDGDQCRGCISPSRAQCQRLVNCGGDPCPALVRVDAGVVDGGVLLVDVDPYAGAAGRLAKGLRETMERGASQTFHTDIASFVDGGVGSCATVVYMNRDQRAAWIRSVDASAGGSEVVDCRTATMPAAFRRSAGVRRSVLSGMSADGSAETDPESAVEPLDAGPE
jgi:hypothetical protein